MTKQETTLLLTRIESRFCIVGSPSHEFIIILFYNEGARLVAVNWGQRERRLTARCASL